MSLKWTEYQALRVSGKEKTNVAWWVNDKFKLNQFLVENSIPTPEIFEVWENPNDIQLNDFNIERFVLKPSNMHSAAGVMVIERKGPDIFYDSLTRKRYSQQQIIDKQIEIYEKCKYKGSYKIFVEEKIISSTPSFEIPLDYKVFCFYGKPMMIFQFDRNTSPKRAAWFDEDFSPLNVQKYILSDWSMINRGDNVLSIFYKDMLNIASKTSVLVDSPFMSVDMYSSNRGALVGELTPAPGGPFYGDMYKFHEDFDYILGKAWEDAVTRMK